MFWKKKRAPEHDINKLVAGIKISAEGALKSVIVFGSFASGEFHPEHSDVNLLVVFDPLTLETLTSFQKSMRDWAKAGHTPPIFVSSTELPLLARTHPIEFIDMQEHHRVILGDDVLASLQVDTQSLRPQIEHDLSQILLKLRQWNALTGSTPGAIKKLLIDSTPSVLTLFRATLRLQENTPRLSKIEAAERLAPRAGIDPLLLRRLANFRFERKSDDLDGLMASYLEVIEKVRQFLATV